MSFLHTFCIFDGSVPDTFLSKVKLSHTGYITLYWREEQDVGYSSSLKDTFCLRPLPQRLGLRVMPNVQKPLCDHPDLLTCSKCFVKFGRLASCDLREVTHSLGYSIVHRMTSDLLARRGREGARSRQAIRATRCSHRSISGHSVRRVGGIEGTRLPGRWG